MLGSKNFYFFQNKELLEINRNHLQIWLSKVWLLKDDTVNAFLEAYDYFCENPGDFDGSTVINDFYIIPGLDIWAMIHDYMYIRFNVAANLFYKFLSDLLYAKTMRTFKHAWIPVWIFRFCGLTITSIPFSIYKRLRYKLRMTEDMKIDFINYCKKFE